MSTAPACGSPYASVAREMALRAEDELEQLVAISTPSGDRAAAEKAVDLCVRLLPEQAIVERLDCSSPDHADDLLARIEGKGKGRLLLLGHLDTVVPHAEHRPLIRHDGCLRGSGAVDMKGGDVLAIALMRRLADEVDRFAELALLLVVDEEWRSRPFAHVERFAGHDACLCFEGGERTPEGIEGVVVRRKAASALRVRATGRAAHAGSNPDAGANALLALAGVAQATAALHDPDGPHGLTVVPSVIRSGQALNVVPPDGELLIDMRASDLVAFEAVLDVIPKLVGEVRVDVEVTRSWPGMDSAAAVEGLLAAAGGRVGREIVGVARGGASDASHFASAIAVTIDGLGPRGGQAHAPGEHIIASSLAERAEIALAILDGLLGRDPAAPATAPGAKAGHIR